jgi:hypothetical protein
VYGLIRVEQFWLRANASVVVVLLALFSPGTLAASPENIQGPEPVKMPDIRANIIKMLQQSRGVDSAIKEDLFDQAEKQQKKALQQAPVEQTEEPAKSTTAKPATTPTQQTGSPVELPLKEIVIEDLDDLKKLAEELRKAKKRQSRQ